jgi:hypothetical protein
MLKRFTWLNFIFSPYLPIDIISRGLESVYGVLVGLSFSEAFTLFWKKNLFQNISIYNSITNIIFIGISLIISSSFFLMTWSELFTNLLNIPVYVEHEPPKTSHGYNKIKRVSYFRLLPSIFAILAFSAAPWRVSSVVINYINYPNIEQTITSEFQVFFGWIALSLFIFCIWRVCIALTSIKKKEAFLEMEKQIQKNLGMFIIALYSFLYYSLIIPKNSMFYYFYPTISFFLFLFFSWGVVFIMQTQKNITIIQGLLINSIICLFLLIPYLIIK